MNCQLVLPLLKAALVLLVFSPSICVSGQEAERASATSQPTTVRRVIPGGVDAPPPHPLTKAIAIARQFDRYIENNVRDFTCVLVKRERVNDELRAVEQMQVKCRHERTQDGKVVTPFSVYLKFLAPRDYIDREVLYVKGRDNDDALVRKGGRRSPYLNWWIDPYGSMALRDNRYPITEFGFATLTKRLIEVAEEDSKYDECEVKYRQGAKIDDRTCFVIDVMHPVKRDYFRFHKGRIFIDNELHVPIHYESYDWPEEAGQPPLLLEQYTYRNLRLNVGLTDSDFDRLNPAYGFRKN